MTEDAGSPNTPRNSNPPKKLSIALPSLLLVEGSDEYRLIGILLRRLGLAERVQIETYNGVASLQNFVNPAIDDGSLHRLGSFGIIRDADSSAGATFDSVCHHLDKFQLTKPPGHGIFTSGQPRVGVYIMPDGKSNGMLEDLCLRSVVDHPAMACVDTYMECLGVQGVTLKNPSKSRAHALLATYDDGAKRLGEAAESKSAPLWNFDHSAFDELKSFLRALAVGAPSSSS